MQMYELETELEKIKESLATIRHMFDLQNNWNDATSTRVEMHSKRLFAIEEWQRIDNDIHPVQSEAVDGGWIPIPKGVWVAWSDGTVTRPGYITMKATHIRPYIPGEPKPEAPEVK
jgi:hypothetical protein